MPRKTLPIPSQRHVLLMIQTDRAHERLMLEGIADYSEHHTHWQVHLEVSPRPEMLLDATFDGMIVEPTGPLYNHLGAAVRPLISVAHTPDPSGPPSVTVDNQAVGRMAADHLADLGLRNLVYVPPHDAPWARDRGRGFLDACTVRGLNCAVFDNDLTESQLIERFKTLPTPIGVLAANDRWALTVSRAARGAGLRIPEQLALISVDNEAETCRLADPPLTSIDHGTRRIGYEAARMLDRWMSTGQRPDSVLIQPVGVVARPSTDLLAIDDPDVVAALRYIRSHADKPTKVADVLKHVAMSRRSLEMHFSKALGRTIHEEITRVRIDRAKHLLISSDWSIVHISDACGFAFPSQFSYAFRREVGLPPARFRDRFRYKRT
jgi:LacI family transcriptional regulator